VQQQTLPEAISALFPSAVDRGRVDAWLTEQLQQALRRVQAGPVMPTVDIARFRAELEAMDFDGPRPLEDILRWSIERMEHGIVQMSNPRYFGLFNPGPNFPAQCADRETLERHRHGRGG
jgi:aromatic-L-amino-acid decarboxylase